MLLRHQLLCPMARFANKALINGTTVGFMNIHVLRDVTPSTFTSMLYAFTSIHGEGPVNTGHHMELPQVITASHRHCTHEQGNHTPTVMLAQWPKVHLVSTKAGHWPSRLDG